MTRRPKQTKPEEIETKPDGWDRFTKAVKKMAPERKTRQRVGVHSRKTARKKAEKGRSHG